MQENETGKNLYEYRFSLSYENPIEAEAIRLIRERDRLEYPTIKLYLLKKMLRPKKWEGQDTEGTGYMEAEIQELTNEIKNLKKEIEEIKGIKNPVQTKDTPAMQKSVLNSPEEEPSDHMNLSGFDDIADNLLSGME